MTRVVLLASGLLFCVLMLFMAGTLSQKPDKAEFILQGPGGTSQLESVDPQAAWQAGVRVVAAILIGLFVISLIVKSTRRQVLGWLISLTLLLVILTLFAKPSGEGVVIQAAEAEIRPPDNIAEQNLPVVDFDTVAKKSLPAWLRPLLSGSLLAGGTVLLWKIRRLAKTVRPPDALAEKSLLDGVAQETLAKLDKPDGDIDDAIVSCYRQLQELAAASFKTPRQLAMTPREHSAILARLGADAAALGELTTLYEQVRYGRQKSGQPEADRARRALRKLTGEVGS